jgi:amino acid adenylation domain-containing protein/thioester reductase-like protein
MSTSAYDIASINQEHIYGLEQQAPGDPVLLQLAAIRIDGLPDTQALHRSINEIFRRHSALRSVFRFDDGHLERRVDPDVRIELPIVECGGSSTDEVSLTCEVRRRASEEVRTQETFNLAAGPLVRASLLRFGDDVHVLLLIGHASVLDGPSLEIFARELSVIYDDTRARKACSLPPLAFQDTNFARWQRQWLRNVGVSAHVPFWTELLSGEQPVLEFPTDRPRSPSRSTRSAAVSTDLSPELTAGLEALSRREGISLFLILLSAYEVLLHRYTDQGDILVGTPTAGRSHPESNGLIGRFQYPLLLRARLVSEMSFRELLRHVAEVCASAEAHKDMPYAALWEHVAPPGAGAQGPLVQASFELYCRPAPIKGEEITLSLLTIEPFASMFDVSLVMELAAKGLSPTLIYSVDLFDEGTAARMLRHFEVLLDGIVKNPDRPIGELPLLTAPERQRLLVEWNDTRTEYPRDACIHELFEARAASAPNAIAAVFQAQELTYQELNRRANRLARRLAQAGVGPDVPVGVFVERSLDMLVGLLAILKAGGAYVPLDPEYPIERLQVMLEDSGARVLLARRDAGARLYFQGARIDFTNGDSASADADQNIVSGATAASLAYVMFTSGSTGRPKGAAVPHRAVVRLVVNTNYVSFLPSDRVMHGSNLAFDASTFEIWGALLHGAQLVLVTKEELLNFSGFAATIRRQGITVMFLSTALFHQMVGQQTSGESPAEDDLPEAFSGLRYLVIGGDKLELDPARRALAKGGTLALVNGYGPTENTTFSTAYRVNNLPADAGSIPIGLPISNSTAYVLDRRLQPVPIGVRGELYVGGDGVARGYLNRPELTAERFIKNPFSEDAGARLYKTGDLVRYRPDGTIEFLGRIDTQVKLRGFRVELGEIETLLGQFPKVREVVIVVREDVPGDKRLTAYLSAANGVKPTPSELRGFLQGKLPSFMLPSTFVILDKLPLTPNGKVDRKALPAPPGEGADARELRVSAKGIEAVLSQHPGVREAFVVARDGGADGPRLVAFFVKKSSRSPLKDDLVSFLAERLPGSAAVSAFIPLIAEHERVLVLEQEYPGNPASIHVAAARIDGPLDVRVFRRAVNEVIRRHAALRTTFPSVRGRPAARVNPAMSVEPAVMDFALLPDYLWDAEVLRQAGDEPQRPFDLASGPLLRMSLLRFGRDVHMLLVAAHKAIFDEASGDILLQEIIATYPSVAEGFPSPLPSQRDVEFGSLRRQWLKDARVEDHLSYWRGRLSGELSPIQLLTDHARPAVRTFQSESVSVELSPALVAGIQRLGEIEGVSPRIVLLAAWAALLHRYTDQTDILVGMPFSGRFHAESSRTIGRLGYFLPIRVDLSGEPSFSGLLRRVGTAVTEAEAHGDIPFATLLDGLPQAADSGAHPLFQVGFELLGDAKTAAVAPGLTVTPLEIERAASELDLSLVVTLRPEAPKATLVYSTDLWERSTIERLLDHAQMLLEGAVASPTKPTWDLSLLSDFEREQVLIEWNNTSSEYPRDATVNELFERQVELSPDALAAVSGAQSITYFELNLRANRLARELRLAGVGPEVRVGVFAERSIDTLVAWIAILKVGGVYVPLDPGYPRERLELMIADAGVAVLLIGAAAHSISFQGAKINIAQPMEAGPGDANPLSVTGAWSLAYVIFTSGSTGRPKGVAVTHRAITRLVINTNYVEVSPSDRVLHASNLSFDASTFEVWGALLNGACLFIMSQETLLSPTAFSAEMRRNAITVMFISTALFHTMASMVPEAFGNLRYLFFGGEKLDPKAARTVLERGAPRQLVHVYGPTENTTFSTAHLVREVPASATSVPIGRPISNSVAYVLDRHMKPVPVGVPGELYVGGDGLAREYLNHPDLTAERFVTVSLEPGLPVRLYKTGDRVRWLAEGAIDFLGRFDHQVKIRGFRVELGEIEVVLDALPGVRAAIVVVRESTPGDKRIVAYVSPEEGARLKSPEIRAALQDKLPPFMIPSAIVVLKELPLNPNGKVDRAALPAPEREGAAGGEEFVAPRSAMEVTLSMIWGELLGVSRVGVHDNFFELGGHSLLAAKLLARLRDEFQVDLPVRTLFDTPTIVALAGAIEEQRAKGPASKLQPIKAVSRDRPLPLSFAQQQLWLLIQVEPESPFYNEPFTVRMPGRLDVGALERTLQEIVRRHEILRTTFSGMRGKAGLSTAPRYSTMAWSIIGGGQRVLPRTTMGPPSLGPLSIAPTSGVPSVSSMPTQLVSSTSTFTLTKIDLRDLPEAEREAEGLRIATDEARRPFNLGVAPLVRATLVRLRDEEHRLYMTMHHIITDGVSLHSVLLREISVIYDAFTAGRPSPLPDLPIQFGDFAVWQRKTQTVEACEPHIEYWDRKLVGASMLNLPTDGPRPAAKTYKGRKYYFPLQARVVSELKTIGRRQGATLFMVLLSAFKVLLHRYSGQDDIIVGTATSGRPTEELSNLIGFFVNTVPLRTDLRDAPTFCALLDRVREVTLEAYAHQNVPFEMLVEELRVVRTPSQNPLFQVVFVLEPPLLPTESGWSISQHDVDTGTSKFDLTLDIDERPDGAIARFEYDSDLFTADTIERMAAHFKNLLAAIAVNPNARVSALPLMTLEEEAAVLPRCRSRTSIPKAQCLHELFEAQVARTPAATAVHFEASRLTYRELDRRSNQLASYLRRLGVGPEVLVAIYMERSIDVVVAILAVLKAGGAYVPLDPEFPAARIAHVLGDCQAPVILTQARLKDRLPETLAKRVAVDGDWAVIAGEPDTALQAGVGPDNLAYVMYSAGALGKPKGVLIPHHNVVRLFRATQDEFNFSERDVWTMFHSPAFDFSLWEMWGALLHGGKLIIVPRSTARSPEELYLLLRTHRVTVLSLVPAAFLHLMRVEDDQDGIGKPDELSLRSVFLGGEAFDFRTLKPWLDRYGDQKPRLWNLYGLTGATIFVTYRPITLHDVNEITGSRIGQPVSDMELYILDRELRPVPAGVPGEIYLGGPGLARGYLNQPDLETERFAPHPWSDEPSARLFRTHDRARLLPNDDIEYMGRLDEQMKIRGFRVEPTEIEAVLLEHPDVREAVVTVREDTPGDQRLVAYYVKRGDRIPTTNEFRSFLRERLPDYLVPTIYIVLPSIPSAASGKTNRKSLPAPDKHRPSLMPVFRLPSSAVEVLVLGIWTRVLQVNQIGRNDDFFSLGGHSLLAAQMIARVRETFRIDVRHSSFLLREFLETPTVAGLAEAVEMVRDATPSVRAKRGTSIDYDAEARLDFSIRFDAPPVDRPPDDPTAVFLTGATGFLGAFLLHELLKQTRADIYCLVRAPDPETARKRIESNMRQSLVWDDSLSSRIIPVPGDLSQLLLGLTPEKFAELAERVDVIYHNGSFVNFIYPYTALKAANVGGTQEVIRLATQARLKPVHYVSTLAVLVSYGFLGLRSVSEDVVLANANRLYMGYPESKYVAEKLLMQASQQGLPVSIFRPHDVTGHSQSGAWKTEGFLCSFLRSLFELGAAPDFNLPLDFAPVDYVTRAIVHISMNEPAVGTVYHLNNPRYNKLPNIVKKMQDLGYPIQKLPYHTWVQKLVDYTARNPTASIAPFVPLFVERWSEAQISVLEMYVEERIPLFDTRNARMALQGTGIVCPPVDDALLNKYLKYFQQIGFLPPPPAKVG